MIIIRKLKLALTDSFANNFTIIYVVLRETHRSMGDDTRLRIARSYARESSDRLSGASISN
ncbi:hypothetical protein V1478_014086 [Vespula squamosa]|uniref:Uncharacterized protein n=1 Tax=Vespula squamosa TaxID=30214 RepID=A0ABD2A9E6_VESSQ